MSRLSRCAAEWRGVNSSIPRRGVSGSVPASTSSLITSSRRFSTAVSIGIAPNSSLASGSAPPTSASRIRAVHFPLREAGLNKTAVIGILESSGLGLPAYYRWQSRSGCTFCFYQQKIEWVRLVREHLEAFEEAKSYEKTALEHGSPFTWTERESFEELARPERVAQIEKDYEPSRGLPA